MRRSDDLASAAVGGRAPDFDINPIAPVMPPPLSGARGEALFLSCISRRARKNAPVTRLESLRAILVEFQALLLAPSRAALSRIVYA